MSSKLQLLGVSITPQTACNTSLGHNCHTLFFVGLILREMAVGTEIYILFLRMALLAILSAHQNLNSHILILRMLFPSQKVARNKVS